MAPLIQLACGAATILSYVLAVQTGKGTAKTINRRKRRNARKNGQGSKEGIR